MGTDRSTDLTQPSEEPVYCARHPQVETSLTCGRCGTPICPRCLVQSHVGARCRECAGVTRLPTVTVSPVYVVRGLAAALVGGAATGALWGLITRGSNFVGLFIIFGLALGVGWAVSEAISLATNHKRSPVLQACAVGGVVLAYFVHNAVEATSLLPSDDTFGYLATALAAFFAASRLRV